MSMKKQTILSKLHIKKKFYQLYIKFKINYNSQNVQPIQIIPELLQKILNRLCGS